MTDQKPTEVLGAEAQPPAEDERSLADLKAQARLLGVPVSGTKLELEERIEANLAGVALESVAFDGYSEGRWKGYPNFTCETCGYARLRRRDIIIHLAETGHGQPS